MVFLLSWVLLCLVGFGCAGCLGFGYLRDWFLTLWVFCLVWMFDLVLVCLC